MIWVLFASTAITICFSFVILLGAPYLPTRKQQINQALSLLKLNKGDTLYELGAGSGGLTLQAAKLGIKVKAFEINPILFLLLLLRTRKYRSQIDVKMTNFWSVDLKEADGIYVFLIDRYMKRLDAKVTKDCNGTKLVSYTFKIPGKKPTKTSGPMYLYKY